MWTTLRTALTRIRLSIALLTERRLALYAWIDFLLLFPALIMAFNGANGSAKAFYFPLFILPVLFIAVPMLSDTVAVERRSGTLDLALTSPGARWYFERRVLAVAALMIVHGCVGVVIGRLLAEEFDLVTPFFQIVMTSLFVAAVALNWSARFKSAGAVMFATYLTFALFSPWFFSNPIFPPTTMQRPRLLEDWIDYAQKNLVLACGAAVFYLYARQRLARPERLIA
jgi:hypothetical protein